jgi:hypothetical protein
MHTSSSGIALGSGIEAHFVKAAVVQGDGDRDKDTDTEVCALALKADTNNMSPVEYFHMDG